MNNSKKTKLCWNCEGVVDRSAENCVYCAVYLHPEEEEREAAPPYTPPNTPKEALEPVYKPETVAASPVVKQEETVASLISPILLLMAGSLLLLFGVILFLFSREGVFTLKWNATYWFVYLLLSLPLLYMGWRALQKFEDREAISDK